MRRSLQTALWVMLAVLLSLLAPATMPGVFEPLSHVLDDWRTRDAISPNPEARLIIVDIDERSIREQGPWPWPRAKLAHLFSRLLNDLQVASVAVDIVFPEPRDDDGQLAAELARAEVTGAVVYDLEHRALPALEAPKASGMPTRFAVGAPLAVGKLAQGSHSGLAAAHIGHITPLFDNDGAVRRMPPLVCTASGRCDVALALGSYASLIDGPSVEVVKGRSLLAPPWWLILHSRDGAAAAQLPLNQRGELAIPYRHARQDWISISASDILDGKADPRMFKGVMTLIGSTALGLSDVIATPISPVAAGLEPHAETLSALMDGDFPYVPKHGLLLDALLMLPLGAVLLGLLAVARSPARRALVGPVWLLLAWALCAVVAVCARKYTGLLLPLPPLLLFAPLATLLVLLREFYLAANERAGIFGVLSAYLPRPVASRLATIIGHNSRLDAIDASRRDITVLFADIHGFAGMTEERSPEQVARLMQAVFTEMAAAVVEHKGTIDKFIGDAIMAFWNAPLDDDAHAQHALDAAQDIRARMQALADHCKSLGFPAIDIGIGIESGPALVGNFGSIHRRTFTALGETVVLASRLVGLTANLQQPILIGEGCAHALKYAGVRALAPIQVRGRLHPITPYVIDQ